MSNKQKRIDLKIRSRKSLCFECLENKSNCVCLDCETKNCVGDCRSGPMGLMLYSPFKCSGFTDWITKMVKK